MTIEAGAVGIGWSNLLIQNVCVQHGILLQVNLTEDLGPVSYDDLDGLCHPVCLPHLSPI